MVEGDDVQCSCVRVRVRVRARAPIKKGQEIFISYGDHSMPSFLGVYGFTIPEVFHAPAQLHPALVINLMIGYNRNSD